MSAVENNPTTTDNPEAEERGRRGSNAVPVAVWTFSFLILRIFAVSGYDWHTSFEVSTTISVNDGLALMFGSLMAGHLLVAIMLVFVLPLLIATLLWSPGGHRPSMVLAVLVGLVALLTHTLSFHSWWVPLSTAGVLGLFVLVRRLSPHRSLRRAMVGTMARAGWVAGVAVLLLAALLQTPWVPMEQIETADGPISVYVLSVDSGYLNVLTEDHEFQILNRDDVRSRK